MKYEPSELFRSTAPYYARYRAGYPPELFAHLAQTFTLDQSQDALDLGCGTGQIAIPLAPFVRQVLAVDPEPTMLEQGRQLAADGDVPNVVWREGDSHHLSELGLGDLALVTMGASFHWMDRPAVLATLDQSVRLGGGIAVVSGGAAKEDLKPAWDEVVTAVRTRWLGEQRRAGSGTYTHPEQRHEEIFASSPFSHVQVTTWTWAKQRDLDSVVGLQFSYSYSSLALLGDNAAKFESELRHELLAANPSGIWTEAITTEAIIGTRPNGAE